MTHQSILIQKSKITGEVISQQLLFDSEDTEHLIITTELPVIEDRPGYTGSYKVNADNTVEVVYTAIPKTQLDIIQEQLQAILGNTNVIMDDGLLNMDMLISSDEKLTDIQDKVTPGV